MVTKRQLRIQLDNAQTDAYNASVARGAAEQRAETAESRLSAVLAVVMNGKDNLEGFFESLTDLGVDETDTYLRFAADDGLAYVQVNPATGEVFIQDPKNQVEAIKVTFDREADLDVAAQREIQRFRADVMLMRHASNTAVTGKVSLKARSPRRDQVADPALAPVREG